MIVCGVSSVILRAKSNQKWSFVVLMDSICLVKIRTKKANLAIRSSALLWSRHSISHRFCLTQFTMRTQLLSPKAAHCLELATTALASLAKKSVISLSFQSRTKKGRQLTPVPAVCCGFSTLYMFSKVDRRGRQLVYGDRKINEGEPVSLFVGQSHAAAISNRSEVIFINRDAVAFTPDSYIEAFSLPHGEKASSIACLNAFVFVSSSNGRVFSSSIIRRSRTVFFGSFRTWWWRNCLYFRHISALPGSQQGIRPTWPWRRNKKCFVIHRDFFSWWIRYQGSLRWRWSFTFWDTRRNNSLMRQ